MIDDTEDSTEDDCPESILIVSEILSADEDEHGTLPDSDDTSSLQNSQMISLSWEKPVSFLKFC